jgi:hypothetical protein
VGGGALHHIWKGVVNGYPEIIYRKSTDLGTTWQDSAVISPQDGEWSQNPCMIVSEDVPPRIYVTWRDTRYGCFGGFGCSIIMRASGDGGDTWGDEYVMTDTPTGYNSDWTQQVAARDEKVAVVWSNYQTGHINMRYSLDRGDSWSLLCDVTPGRAATDPSCAITPSAVHILWDDIDTGSTSGSHIYYRRGLILSDQVEELQTHPEEFSLFQNYPNPFNPTTELHFDLPEPAMVSLAVYDLLGRKVADLASGHYDAGYHWAVWNATDMASGVYLARFSVVNELGNTVYTKTNKPVLIK